jgi:hypothetical protein
MRRFYNEAKHKFPTRSFDRRRALLEHWQSMPINAFRTGKALGGDLHAVAIQQGSAATRELDTYGKKRSPSAG